MSTIALNPADVLRRMWEAAQGSPATMDAIRAVWPDEIAALESEA